ncbi:MAG: response regulator transcription factor [Actinobacteria bacterium]|nr:response regulator transcription factor [Actinomycetota bacterium]
MAQVLLVEDDAGIRAALSLALEDEGYDIMQAPDGRTGLSLAASEQPDLVLLDLRLPDVSGFEVCREIRQKSNVPIIIVTAQTDTHDLVAGLEAGADDYVTKPVNTKELAARIRAALRRLVREVSGRSLDVSRFGDIELHREAGIVKKAGVEVPLTKTELRLLIEFADHPNMVLSRDQLLERVWGYDYLGDSRLVDAHIRRLRVKIEDSPNDPRYIITNRGLGYRFLPGA